MSAAQKIHRMVRSLERDVRARTKDKPSAYSRGYVDACVYIAEGIEEDFDLEG